MKNKEKNIWKKKVKRILTIRQNRQGWLLKSPQNFSKGQTRPIRITVTLKGTFLVLAIWSHWGSMLLTFTGRVFLDQFWSYLVHFRPGAFSSFLESSSFCNPIHLYFALGILRFLQTQFIFSHLWILRFFCNPIHLLLPWIPQVSATQFIPFVSLMNPQVSATQFIWLLF